MFFCAKAQLKTVLLSLRFRTVKLPQDVALLD